MKNSYLVKEPLICPACRTSFQREEMLTGRGRLIAQNLQIDLRRTYSYKEDQEVVNPLFFNTATCPNCLTSLFHQDFAIVAQKPELIELLREKTLFRKEMLTSFKSIYPLSFKKARNPFLGACSLALASETYQHIKYHRINSITKSALCALRASWLFSDSVLLFPKQETILKDISQKYYQKASLIFASALELVSEKQLESVTSFYFGPDLDNNYSFDGFIYIAIYLQYYHSHSLSKSEKLNLYSKLKAYLSRAFGLGKASREKPSNIINLIRDLYTEINQTLESLEPKN